MCGRYTRRRYVQELSDEFEAEFAAEMALEPSYNVAPAQNCLVIGPGARKLDIFKWGLVPSWSTAETGGATRINACAETLTERASYKPILARGRCLIPADGFYEWEKPFKQPYLFTMGGGEPFVFAGLCDTWEKPDGSTLKTFTIITTSPNQIVAPIHDRMPAIIDRADIDAWLDPDSLMATALSLLKPYRAEAMQSAPVRPLVNNVKNNGPNLVDPIVLPQRFAQSEFGW